MRNQDSITFEYGQLNGLLCCFYLSLEAENCIVYTQQPPSCLSCNPYNNENSPPQLQLTLACGVQRTDDKTDKFTFDLRWFNNYSSKALDHIVNVRTRDFNNISVLVTSPGQYWCQVLDYTDGNPGHLLGRSSVAEVLSWEWYSSLPMCKGVQSVMESKCVDLSPSSPSIGNPPTCFMPKTEVQTRIITGKHLCVLFICCMSVELIK